MRYAVAIISLMMLSSMLTSCSRDLDIELPAHESSLVVECYLEDGQPLRALVTESTALLDSNTIPSVIMDAVVTITYAGLTDTLEPYIYVDSARNRVYNYGSNTIVKANYASGEPYRIDVVDSKGRHAFGITRFLVPVPITSITPFFNDLGEASLLTTFADDPTQKNYYHLVVMRNSHQDSIQQNRVFTDEFANNVGDIVMRTGYRFVAGDSVHATLLHLDYNHYQYFNTSENASSALVNPFAASGEVVSNIKGGFGVFAALSAAGLSIKVE